MPDNNLTDSLIKLQKDIDDRQKNINDSDLQQLVAYLKFYYENELCDIFSEKVNIQTVKNEHQQELIAKYQNLLNINNKGSKRSIKSKDHLKINDETSNNNNITTKLLVNNDNNHNKNNIKFIADNSKNNIHNQDYGNFNKIQSFSSTMTSYALNEIIANAQNLAMQANNIQELKQIVNNFDGCSLKKMASNTVFADGNANANIMVIGEAPGNNEDLQGVPFCGDSGKLLDEIFNSINLNRRDNLYITNTIFWRPPGNRQPTNEELAICRPFLDRHIELFNPQLIILVGATAMNNIIGNDKKISDYRGQFYEFDFPPLNRKINSFTIFHPSYLLRQSSKKKITWLDMMKIEEFLLQKNQVIS
jgi:uracil-DNA glycosylase family 4